MKKIAIIVAKKLLQNNVFTTIPPLDFDNYLYHQRLLRTELSKIGYDLATYDINKVEDSDFIFYYDTVYPLPLPSSKKKYFLFLWESEVISPKTYNVDLHKYFDKILNEYQVWGQNGVNLGKGTLSLDLGYTRSEHHDIDTGLVGQCNIIVNDIPYALKYQVANQNSGLKFTTGVNGTYEFEYNQPEVAAPYISDFEIPNYTDFQFVLM